MNGSKQGLKKTECTFKFAKNSDLVHFEKHGSSLKKAFSKTSYSISEYLSDANHVIKNGQWVPELNGYVKLIGGKGSPKYAFVGINRTIKNITTFHVKTAKELSKIAPSLGITVI